MSGIISDNVGRASGLVKAAGGGGNLGQVTQLIYQTQTAQTTADHDIMTCASITPASSSSRFLIKINLQLGWGSNVNGGMILYRDSTALSVTAASPHSGATDSFWSSDESPVGSAPGIAMGAFYYEFIDSPSTASGIVYKLSAKSISTMWYNRCKDNTTSCVGISTMTLMELLS